MKVLLAFPILDQQTGLYIKNAFEELSCVVEVLDPKINPHTLYQLADQFQPDLIFCSRTPELLPEVKKIRVRLPGIKIACWNVDVRNSVVEFGETLLNLFNSAHHFYTIAEGSVYEYQNHCPSSEVIHLQEGIDPKYHNRFELTDEDHKTYDCDVLFAGEYSSPIHEGRIELLNHLMEQDFNFKLFGKGAYEQAGDNYLLNEEHSKACQCAKIVIGHSGWPKVNISMSARDYRIMGAGGFLLTNHVKGIYEWFTKGMCETYRSKEECVEKIKFYLENKVNRIVMAKIGYLETHDKHKFVDRMKVVLKNVNKINKITSI